jgi:hypothetical protein
LGALLWLGVLLIVAPWAPTLAALLLLLLLLLLRALLRLGVLLIVAASAAPLTALRLLRRRHDATAVLETAAGILAPGLVLVAFLVALGLGVELSARGLRHKHRKGGERQNRFEQFAHVSVLSLQ